MKYPTTEQAVEELTIREALLPPQLRALRQKLSQKAKQQKRFRFYSLYAHVCRADTLQAAWDAVRLNDGAPGVDGVSIEQIAASPESEAAFLEELQRSLKQRTYRAQAVRRVYIPKPNGKLRPLGIPTVRDRVVQAAVLVILEPIFEADFEDCSYGFRPGRSAHQALKAIQQHLQAGYSAVYDADLAGYFDSIPQDKLIACVRMRVVDGAVLGLIRQWLNAPVVEPAKDKGQPPTISRNSKGTPQGGVLSPLLANIYLHWFDRAFHRADGPAHWAKAKLVRYADDFVVLARHISPQVQCFIEGKLEGWLGLQLNREKTRIVSLQSPGQSLDFLGYTFRYDRDRLGRAKRYWNLTPSRKALTRERAVLHEKLSLRRSHVPLVDLITELNRHLRGWARYYSLGYPRKAMRDINAYVLRRLAQHLKRRSQRGWQAPADQSHYRYFARMGLLTL
jgi:RNA-directed DNA polymerase